MTDMYVAKVPDKTILDMLSELKEKYGSNHMGIDLGGVPLPESDFDLIRKRKGTTFLINSFSFNPGDNTFNVNMNRGNVLPSLNPAYYLVSIADETASAALVQPQARARIENVNF